MDKFDLETRVTVLDAVDFRQSSSTTLATKPPAPRLRPQRNPDLISASYKQSGQSVEEPPPTGAAAAAAATTTGDAGGVETVLDNDSDLLCLSPSRLIVAFGVLLVVLLLALVAACMLWLRARSALRRPSPFQVRERAVRQAAAATAVVPAGHRPVFAVRSPHPTPYIRVVQ